MESKLDAGARREEMLQRLGSALRAARERAGLTQAQLAERASTTDETVGRIERGLLEPGFLIILGLRDAFGLALDSLFSDRSKSVDSPPEQPGTDRISRAYSRLSSVDRRALLSIAEHLPSSSKARPGRSRRSGKRKRK